MYTLLSKAFKYNLSFILYSLPATQFLFQNLSHTYKNFDLHLLGMKVVTGICL